MATRKARRSRDIDAMSDGVALRETPTGKTFLSFRAPPAAPRGERLGSATFEVMAREFQDDLVSVNSARLRALGVSGLTR
jgi:hypothetical protein